MRSPKPDERLPLARTAGLSVNDVGGEILVYDSDTDFAHCLSETAALVWRACDGKLTLGELTDREALDPDMVRRALGELNELGLLDSTPVRVQKSAGGISRRQAVGRLAAAAVGPLVVSVAAPAAWAATSTRDKSACIDGTCPTGTVGCQNCGSPCGATTVCPPGANTSCSPTGGCTSNCCPVGYGCATAGGGTCVRTFA
jgi:hypothetical protein